MELGEINPMTCELRGTHRWNELTFVGMLTVHRMQWFVDGSVPLNWAFPSASRVAAM